jgi:hypothetical protein
VVLPEDKNQIARSLTEKMIVHSTSAAPTKVGKPDIETIARNVRDKQFGFKFLVHEFVESPMFRRK